MPTYVYACDTCHNQFEKFQSFKEEPLQSCPKCTSAIRRVFQPVGIVFKGSGWYITDSRKSDTAVTPAETKKVDTSAETSTKAESSEKTISTESVESKPSTESKPASTPAAPSAGT